MDKVVLGQYIPGDSLIHRLDPRAKLISAVWFILLIFMASHWWTIALLAATVLIAAKLSNIPIRYYIDGLKPLMVLILITVLFQLVFSQGDTVLFEIGWLRITQEGIYSAILIILRFVMIVLMSTILTLTTTPLEIADGIEALLNPLKKLKVPVQEIALILSIALRFVPTLMQETEKIMNAQRARGVDFSAGSLIERMKKVVPLLIPLFISSIDRADQLAVAMTARGYRGGDSRTKLRQLIWKKLDTFVTLYFIGLTLLLFMGRFILV